MSHSALMVLLTLPPAEIRRRQPFSGPPSFVDWVLFSAEPGSHGVYHLGHLAADCGEELPPAGSAAERTRAMRAAARGLAGLDPAPPWASEWQRRRCDERRRREGRPAVELSQRSLGGGITAYLVRRA